jgi:hypothetical protein
MAARGFLGAGDLYISRYNPATGLFLDYEGPIEAQKFEIKPNSDLKEQTSKGKSSYGQVVESVPVPKPSDFSIEFSEVNKATLETALFGTSTLINTGSGTITAEVMIAKRGYWVPLTKANLAVAGLLVKDTTATTTYVLDVDYQVNYRLGWIRVLATGAIADLASLKVTGAYNAVTGTSISGSTQSQVRAKFKLDGINFADQLPVIVTIHEAVLTPDSAFDFLSNDFAKVGLKGRMKTPVGKSEPFLVELHDSN